MTNFPKWKNKKKYWILTTDVELAIHWNTVKNASSQVNTETPEGSWKSPKQDFCGKQHSGFVFCLQVRQGPAKKVSWKKGNVSEGELLEHSVSVRNTALKIHYLITKQTLSTLLMWQFDWQCLSKRQAGMLRPARPFRGIAYRQTHTCAQKGETLSATAKITVNNLNVYQQGTDSTNMAYSYKQILCSLFKGWGPEVHTHTQTDTDTTKTKLVV